MGADASIYSQIQPVQAPNRLAELAQAMQVQGAMGQNALAQYGLKKAQRGDEETNALAELLKTPGFDLGVVPGGGMDENSERTAQAIASGQLPAPTGMALLNPKNQRILGRVMEINPQYDATTVDAKKKAALRTSPAANAGQRHALVRRWPGSTWTSSALVDALNNGNMQLVNKIGNAYSPADRLPAVTNFDAAKDVVSKEVVKAIVAGGGGVSGARGAVAS
jgi:hypothetical protein